MKEKDRIFIEHMLESIEIIESYVYQVTKDDFLSSLEKQDAVIRRLVITGEAARNISSELRQKYPSIPWQKIIAMRNILIHEYFGVDADLTWETIQKDLPNVKASPSEHTKDHGWRSLAASGCRRAINLRYVFHACAG